MPLLTRESLAHRFRQNWLAKHPVDTNTNATVDDSLTSLNWLQNLNIMKMAAPTPPASPEPTVKLIENVMNTSDMRVNPNAVLNMTNMPVKQETFTTNNLPSLNCKLNAGIADIAPPTPTTPTSMDKTDYKSNPYVKPPYSYATLICMAMRESKKNKITLSGIYNWITENFMYYRVADPSWQNSIRHNLSLNKCFQKVPRRKDEPGKGGFWRINPEYSDMFVNGIFKKRRSTPRETVTGPPAKKVRRDLDDSIVSPRNPSLSNGFSSDDLSEDSPLRLNGEDVNETLRGDFNWNAILHQDIEVGGIRIKTEDIIDDPTDVDKIAVPITTMSPPPSDNNSDVALDDLLNSADIAAGFDDPVDLSTGALDLTVQGYGIRPPEWWLETGAIRTDSPLESSGGLHTPLTASPVPDTDDIDYSHPWAESRADLDEAIASFDLDLQNLFDESLVAVSSITDS